MHVKILGTLILVSLPCAAIAGRKDKPVPTPAVVSGVLACRTIADSTARLACFDDRVKAFEDAKNRRQIVIVDEPEIRTARRGLFGFSLPKLKIFGNDDAEDELKRLETTITDVGHARDGNWLISLAEGGQWLQTDLRVLALSPKLGNKVSITRGALGSYFVSINGQPAIKMSRVK